MKSFLLIVSIYWIVRFR